MVKRRRRDANDVAPSSFSEAVTVLEKITILLVSQLREARRSWDVRQDPAAAFRLLDSACDSLRRLNNVAAALDSFRPQLREAATRQFLELESTIRSASQHRGWRLDGQWPTLYVEHAVTLEFNEESQTVAVDGKVLESYSAAAIMSALEPLVSTLIPSGFSPRVFLGHLAAAYDECRGPGSQTAVLDVYRALVIRTQRPQFWRDARPARFTPLTVDQFRARLSRTLEEGILDAPDGRTLRLLAPLDPRDALFVYQPAEQRFGYVGRIEFVGPFKASA